ncbi:unnamed protein product [Ilex paraguariensis]|uniref:Chaperonin-like RbcX protein n=1 Tax=Ilex paraguariensis TaxID=185542 RepID=A0ABC8T5T4_9AQUA
MKMVGALSMVGSSMVDSHTCPCLCLEALNHKGSVDYFIFNRNSTNKKLWRQRGSLELSSSFVDSRLSAKTLSGNKNPKKQRKSRSLVIVNEVAGQYEDSFEDVKTQMLNYFTYKAVRTVLNQLYEMNPTKYRWFYDFVATNKPSDGKRFIRMLVKEKQDLAERVMITRLHLYGKWIKKCDHAAMYKEISDQNLDLMRERLMETVIWPSDDTNTEKIG